MVERHNILEVSNLIIERGHKIVVENFNLKVFPEIAKSIIVLALIFPGNILSSELLATQLLLFQALLNIVLVAVLSVIPQRIFSKNNIRRSEFI